MGCETAINSNFGFNFPTIMYIILLISKKGTNQLIEKYYTRGTLKTIMRVFDLACGVPLYPKKYVNFSLSTLL